MILHFSAADNASLQRVNEMSHVLDTLLVNYDKRVRPDVGGELLVIVLFTKGEWVSGTSERTGHLNQVNEKSK